jgi:8-oxo-dGTP pyrophosphatase MutT (NUDIX family)
LFIIECGSEKYGLLTVQARIPSGYRYLPELIAGMMDSQTGECQLVAAKEIEEEAGIKIDVNRLVDLGEAELFKSHDTSAICKSNEDAYDWFRVGDPCKTHQGYFNSPGGSSESTTFYLYQETVSHDQLQSMIKRLEGGEHGLKDEGERIRLIMVPLDNLLDIAPDMKVGHAIALHERYLKRLVDNTPLALGSLSMSRMRSEMGE